LFGNAKDIGMQLVRLHNFLLFVVFVLSCGSALATHNRAGEITYVHVDDFTYRVTFTTYTKASSTQADRPTLQVSWGDSEETEEVARVSQEIVGPDIKRNIYVADHTFIGPGFFLISFLDLNRNGGIQNIPNSIDLPFYVESEMVINPFISGGVNNSAILLNPPIDRACLNRTYIHNPGAFDPDGDSITYELVTPRGVNGAPVPLYSLPNEIIPGPENTISLNQKTGDFIWESPKKGGEYNIAIKITEYRDNIKVGSILRDMQITVGICSNTPPSIFSFEDSCVIAGAVFSKEFRANDNDNEPVKLDLTGEMFSVFPPKATFSNTQESPFSKGILTVSTNCEDVREDPYRFLIKATDYTNSFPLVDIKSYYLTVIGPAPIIGTAKVVSGGIAINTEIYTCTEAPKYALYRKRNSVNFTPGNCETGIPEVLGYTKIGEIIPGQPYLDMDVLSGFSYCYRLVALFDIGAESQSSAEFCAEFLKEAILPSKASVGITDQNNGTDSLAIYLPTALDTLASFPPAYQLIFKNNGGEIQTNGSPSYSGLDSAFLHTANTTQNNRIYSAELESSNQKDTTPNFAPPFLELLPGDKKMNLRVISNAPWIDSAWVFQEVLVNGTVLTEYAQNQDFFVLSNLTNEQEYCFRAKTLGFYPGNPIKPSNYSQISCATPVDNEAPCFPNWTMEIDCEGDKSPVFAYNFIGDCADDLSALTLYGFTEAGVPEQVRQYTSRTGTFQLPIGNYTCFAVSTQDLIGNISPLSMQQCITPCVSFVLPNVLSPNGDGINDLWGPLSSRFVKRIQLKVWNRWGETVFETTESQFQWDGTHQKSGKILVAGTYYYGVDVFFLENGTEGQFHLDGFITHTGLH
jgi:gliding motility-associated-like protein